MKFASKELYPGWRMTRAQWGRYWRLLGEACAAQGATAAIAKEQLRQQAHRAAFGPAGKSAKEINPGKETTAIFDALKRLANIVEVSSNARRTALHVAGRQLEKLREVASPHYVATLLKERFKIIAGQRDVSDLSDKQLTDLISTVNNRLRMLGGETRETVTVETDNIPF